MTETIGSWYLRVCAARDAEAQIDRLSPMEPPDPQAARIAELEAEISAHEEHLRAAMLEIGPSEMGCGGRLATLQVEVARQAARIKELEAMTPESWLDYDDEEAFDETES